MPDDISQHPEVGAIYCFTTHKGEHEYLMIVERKDELSWWFHEFDSGLLTWDYDTHILTHSGYRRVA